MKNRKRIILLFMILVMNLAASAQVFILDEDKNKRTNSGIDDVNLLVPLQNVTYDQYQPEEYVPIADGLGLLIGLGGAYLLGKKRKKE